MSIHSLASLLRSTKEEIEEVLDQSGFTSLDFSGFPDPFLFFIPISLQEM